LCLSTCTCVRASVVTVCLHVDMCVYAHICACICMYPGGRIPLCTSVHMGCTHLQPSTCFVVARTCLCHSQCHPFPPHGSSPFISARARPADTASQSVKHGKCLLLNIFHANGRLIHRDAGQHIKHLHAKEGLGSQQPQPRASLTLYVMPHCPPLRLP
jgi:hypothetical protein